MDLKFIRGTKQKFILYVPGDVTARKLRFVVKEDKELTTDRLIEKNNTLNGGSDAELKATYIAGQNRTTLEIFKQKVDDGDFTNDAYYFDVRSISTTDSADDVRIERGDIRMDFSVSSDTDGTNLPSSASRWVNLDASEAEVNDLIQCKLVGGVKVFQLITLTELKQQLDLL
jgi:N-methylhydantoinase B/oxoprolinase/acetone carboxylase alpha subunit